MLDQTYGQPLGDSSWTVYEARALAAQFAEISTDDDKYAAEHFVALCQYLDQLHGGDGFDRLLTADQRRDVAGQISRLLAARPSGSIDQAENTEDSDPELAEVDIDTVVRLDQPVNSALTLAAGRDLGSRLAAADGWQVDLGQAMVALYAYLDELHGGPGQFTELLSTAERSTIADQLMT